MAFGLPDPFGISLDTKFMPSDILRKKRLKKIWDEATPNVDLDSFKVHKQAVSGLKSAIETGSGISAVRRLSDIARRLDLGDVGEGVTQIGLGARRGLEPVRRAFTPWQDEKGRPSFRNATSGESYINYVTDSDVGTRTGETIGRTPGIGGPLRTSFDVAAAPATIGSAGLGPTLSGALRGVPLAGRPLSAVASPAVSGGFGRRVAGEIAAGTGATLGGEALGGAARGLGAPGPLATAASVAGNLVGGGLGAGGLSRVTRRPDITPAPRMTETMGEPEFHATPREMVGTPRASQGGDLGQGLYTDRHPDLEDYVYTGDTLYGFGLKSGEAGSPNMIKIEPDEGVKRLVYTEPVLASELKEIVTAIDDPAARKALHDIFTDYHGEEYMRRLPDLSPDETLPFTGSELLSRLDDAFNRAVKYEPMHVNKGARRYNSNTIDVLRRAGWSGIAGDQGYGQRTLFPGEIGRLRSATTGRPMSEWDEIDRARGLPVPDSDEVTPDLLRSGVREITDADFERPADFYAPAESVPLTQKPELKPGMSEGEENFLRGLYKNIQEDPNNLQSYKAALSNIVEGQTYHPFSITAKKYAQDILDGKDPWAPKPGLVEKFSSLFAPESGLKSSMVDEKTAAARRAAEEAFNREVVEPERLRYEQRVSGEVPPRPDKEVDALERMVEQGKSEQAGPQVSGGGTGDLVTPRSVVEGKLTIPERVNDIFERTMRVLTGSKAGTPEHKLATPYAREAVRQHNVISGQARRFATQAKRAERAFKINPETGESAKYTGWTLEKLAHRKKGLPNLTVEEKNILRDLLRTEGEFRAHVQLLSKSGKGINVPRKSGTWLTSSAVEAYGEKVANETLRRYLKGVKEDLIKQGKIPKKVPDEFQRVFDKATKKAFAGYEPNQAVRLVQTANHAAKLVWASADASLFGIQALLSIADSPRVVPGLMRATIQSLRDPDSLARYLERFDERAVAEGRPTVSEWVSNGLHLAGATSARTDIEIQQGGVLGKIGELPGIKQSNRAFGTTGDILRLHMADAMWDQTKMGLPVQGLKRAAKGSREDVMQSISRAMNRSTGYSETAFGGSVGELALFAPRFLQSQLEVLAKAATDKSIEGTIARRQLGKMVGLGVLATYAINEARGKDTEWNPIKDGKLNSNWLKIKDVGGVDISVFGTWDSLARVIAQSAMGVPGVPGEGSLSYGLETKAGPLLSLIQDKVRGESFSGDEFGSLEYWARAPLPFSIRDIGKDPIAGTVIGAFGAKTAPLSREERMDKELSSAGIERDDPDYEIKRRDYLQQHPELLEREKRDKFSESAKISQNIREREAVNDSQTQANEQTLVDFRNNRKLLNKEKRDKLAIAVEEFDSNPKTKQEKWIDSYYKLFEQANPDPVTGEPDPDALDQLTLDWIEDNGEEAFKWISRYTLSGQTTVERAYLGDLQKLQAAGYFEAPRYRGMRSDLSDDEIEEYRTIVSSARSGDEDLSEREFSAAARQVLDGYGLSREEIQDVINAGKQAYTNPEFARLRNQFHKELMWFNPNAYWRDYQTAGPRSGTGRLSLADISTSRDRRSRRRQLTRR